MDKSNPESPYHNIKNSFPSTKDKSLSLLKTIKLFHTKHTIFKEMSITDSLMIKSLKQSKL